MNITINGENIVNYDFDVSKNDITITFNNNFIIKKNVMYELKIKKPIPNNIFKSNIKYFISKFKIDDKLYSNNTFKVSGGFYNFICLYNTHYIIHKNNNFVNKIIIRHNENFIKSNNNSTFIKRFGECQICMEDTILNQIHPKYDHSFCDNCLLKLDKCPICRADIHK